MVGTHGFLTLVADEVSLSFAVIQEQKLHLLFLCGPDAAVRPTDVSWVMLMQDLMDEVTAQFHTPLTKPPLSPRTASLVPWPVYA